MPVPFNEETLRHIAGRVRIVQDFLEQQLILENPSSYVTFRDSTIEEWEFISRLSEEADCGLLLDVNNVYVSSFNHDWDPVAYISSVPAERVVQFHLAGHSYYTTHLIDTHDNHVIDPVWQFYGLAHRMTGGASTLLEWDANIPSFPVVHQEVLKARQFMNQSFEALSESAQCCGENATTASAFPVVVDSEPLREIPDRAFEAPMIPHPLHHVVPQVE